MKRITSSTVASCVLVCMTAYHPVQAQLAPVPKLLPTLVNPAPAPASAFEPAWPLRFELLLGERESSGFAVTQTGAVHIQLQATGTPLVLSLRRPDGRVIERQGSGQLVIDDTAIAADIAKGVFWGVGIRAVQELPPAPVGAMTARSMPAAVAGGTLSVQHPLADAAVVSAALKKSAAEAQAKATLAPKPAATALDAQAQAKLAQTAHDKQVAAGHAAMLSKLQASVPAAAFAQINQRIGLRLQGQTLQQASAAVPVQVITAKPVNAQIRLTAPGSPPPQMTKAGLLTAKGATGSTQAAATGGASAVGSGGGAAVAAPTAAPSLTALSATEGDPGTPLTLSGSDFGDAPGEVHVIVGSGRDVVAPITYWSAGQIVTDVPYADGIPVYDGHVYVKRVDGTKSALRPFRFLPLYDVTTLQAPIRPQYGSELYDSRLGGTGALGLTTIIWADDRGSGLRHVQRVSGLLFGDRGDDDLYLTSRLRNGWLVESAVIAGGVLTGAPYVTDGLHAWASIADLRAGTDSPYVKVHWWVDGGYQSVAYDVLISVKRPKNLPCPTPCSVL